MKTVSEASPKKIIKTSEKLTARSAKLAALDSRVIAKQMSENSDRGFGGKLKIEKASEK